MANSKYTPEQAAALVASDEPTFIIRAKDALSVGIITAYMNLLLTTPRALNSQNEDALDIIREVRFEFIGWQNENRDKVKFPTL